MTGEWHRLTGVKREVFCGVNGLSTVEGVYVCVPDDIVAVTEFTPSD